MKNHSITYHFLTRSLALLLLAGFLLLSGLHAKQFVDFCMTEMSHHGMAANSHEHCDTKEADKEAKTHGHDSCDWGLICACSVDLAPLSEEKAVISSASSAVILPVSSFDHTFFSSDEIPRHVLQHPIGQHDPPLYLLYDTFLN